VPFSRSARTTTRPAAARSDKTRLNVAADIPAFEARSRWEPFSILPPAPSIRASTPRARGGRALAAGGVGSGSLPCFGIPQLLLPRGPGDPSGRPDGLHADPGETPLLEQPGRGSQPHLPARTRDQAINGCLRLDLVGFLLGTALRLLHLRLQLGTVLAGGGLDVGLGLVNPVGELTESSVAVM